MQIRWKSIRFNDWKTYVASHCNPVRLQWLVTAWLIFIVAVVCHLSTLQNDYLIDDFSLIVTNPFIADWHNVGILFDPKYLLNPYPLKCGARPLTVLSLMLDYRVWGNTTFGYHLTNVLLHGLNSVIVMSLAAAFRTRRRWLVAGFAGLVFAIHPLQCEVVNVPSFRADILATLFYLLAVLLLVTALQAKRRVPALWAGGMIVCFLLGLFSKEIVITFPVVLFAAVLILRKRKISRRALLLAAVSLVLAAVFIFLYWRARYDYFIYDVIFPNIRNNLSPLYSLSVYVSTIFLSLMHNIEKTVFPLQLSVDYVIDVGAPLLNVKNILLCAGTAAGIAAAVRTRNRMLAFGCAFLVFTYAPISNILPLFNTVNDRYMYLPLAGFSLILAALPAGAYGRRRRRYARIATIGAAMLLLAYGSLTVRRNAVFRNSLTLYRDAVRYAPTNIRVRYNLGIAYMAKRSPDDGSNYRNAIREFETLFGLNPFFKRDDAWFCTGLCYAELGDRGNAKKYFLRSFLLGHKQEALDNYANMFWQENRIDTAASLMQISALNYPDAYTYNNLGVYYYQKGKWTRAIDYFTKAIDREPDLVNAWNNLLEIYRRRGDKAMVEKKTYQMITVFSRRGAQIQRGGARITASGAVDGDISDGR